MDLFPILIKATDLHDIKRINVEFMRNWGDPKKKGGIGCLSWLDNTQFVLKTKYPNGLHGAETLLQNIYLRTTSLEEVTLVGINSEEHIIFKVHSNETTIDLVLKLAKDILDYLNALEINLEEDFKEVFRFSVSYRSWSLGARVPEEERKAREVWRSNYGFIKAKKKELFFISSDNKKVAA